MKTPSTKTTPTLRFPGFSGAWEEKKLGEVLKFEQPTKYIVKSTEYNDVYNTPVLTAGKSFILGYTNETDNIFNDLPVIIFDDFTTATQFVDFRFKVKSSAMKILKTKDNNNAKVIFEILKQVKYEVGGHGRHWISKYSHIKVQVPKQNEQNKIAEFLSGVDEWIDNLKKQKENLESYKKGMMQKIFSQEIRFKDENGQDFADWEEKRVKDIFEVTRGDVLAVKNTDLLPNLKNKYPVYSSQTKDSGLMGYYDKYLYEDAITWTTDGANAGDVNFRSGKFYCTNVCGVLINEKGYSNKFTAKLLNSVTRNYVSYVGNPKLMNNVMAQIKIKLPEVQEQQKIAEFLGSVDNMLELKQKQIACAEEWKRGVMQGVFV